MSFNTHTKKRTYNKIYLLSPFLLNVMVLTVPPSGKPLCTLNTIVTVHDYIGFTHLNNQVCLNVELKTNFFFKVTV
jgi:hypothetical protein